MRLRLYAQASTYSDNGWIYAVIPHDPDRKYYWEDEQDTYVLLDIIEVPDPKPSQLVSIGLAKIEEIDRRRKDAFANAEQVIKEYEAKFLMLEVDKES